MRDEQRIMSKSCTFAAAFVEALQDGLSADPRASIVGGYVLGLGPERQLMDRIRADFPDRVIDPPTSEAAIAALGTGAAMAGAHPFVDLGTASFAYLAWSQIANEAAVAHYMTGGRLNVPVTFAAQAPRSTATRRTPCSPTCRGSRSSRRRCRRTLTVWCAQRWQARIPRWWSITRGFSASKARAPTTARRCRSAKPTSSGVAAT
jgi:hypothetical protein